MTYRTSWFHGWGAATKDGQGNGNPSQNLPNTDAVFRYPASLQMLIQRVFIILADYCCSYQGW